MDPPSAAAAPAKPLLVLDTNAALDWLVFRNPAIHPWIEAVVEGRLQLLTCQPMRHELSHMLGHASLARWAVDPVAALATYDHHARQMPLPQPGLNRRLRCTDPDDQIFIDLAIVHEAGWLITQDRALLKLARRARAHGVHVLRPGASSALPISAGPPPAPAPHSVPSGR
jgi:predicted nucleic acid-binding protein